MKSNNVTLVLIFMFLVALVFMFNSGLSKSAEHSKMPKEQPTYANTIVQWYPVAETVRYKVFTNGNQISGNVATLVLDKNANLILIPDNSCEETIPYDIIEDSENQFYNDSVGILKLGPYKTINVEGNVFVQNILNSGCVSQEGFVEIINPTETSVSCNITIEYKHIGC